MTDKAQAKRNIDFFSWYLGGILKEVDEFFPLSYLCRLAGLTQASFLEEAKSRSVELWFKVPENVDTRLFPIRDVLLSDIKNELDYLSVLSADAFGSQGISIPDTHVQVSVGEPKPMEYLLLSFQDLRWHASNKLCVFMEGIRQEDIENIGASENNSVVSTQYQHYNFVRYEDRLPRVFITCKTQDSDPEGPVTLDEERVQRIDVDEMELYVEQIKLLELGYKKKIISEMEGFKSSLLRLMDLEDMPFIDFPEKLFYIFVITCRNFDRTKLGQGINRKLVVDELIMAGIGAKLAQDDIATLIINTRTESGERERFTKRADSSEEEQLKSLNVMGLFAAFKEHYKPNKKIEAVEIISYLTAEHDYPDEAARKIAPIIAGTDDSEPWKGYPLTIS